VFIKKKTFSYSKNVLMDGRGGREGGRGGGREGGGEGDMHYTLYMQHLR